MRDRYGVAEGEDGVDERRAEPKPEDGRAAEQAEYVQVVPVPVPATGNKDWRTQNTEIT